MRPPSSPGSIRTYWVGNFTMRKASRKETPAPKTVPATERQAWCCPLEIFSCFYRRSWRKSPLPSYASDNTLALASRLVPRFALSFGIGFCTFLKNARLIPNHLRKKQRRTKTAPCVSGAKTPNVSKTLIFNVASAFQLPAFACVNLCAPRVSAVKTKPIKQQRRDEHRENNLNWTFWHGLLTCPDLVTTRNA